MFAPAGWKTVVSHIAALLVAILFVASGVWKIMDPLAWAVRLTQLQFPGGLSVLAACVVGVLETYGAVLILVPRFRRWGAWLTGALLVAFMVYIGIHYNALIGEDCSCFPWVKRTIGPMFFVADVAMLALAAIAGWWARPTASSRGAVLALAAIAVFCGVSYGVSERMELSAVAPRTIQVEGKVFAPRQGRVLLFFFDPECLHCDAAARIMAKQKWNDTAIIGIPTEVPEFAHYFMKSTGLNARVSSDYKLLRKAFPYTSTPYAVALENGKIEASLPLFDDGEPEATLRGLHFIQ
jgi:uncharacterized membrane protein YphA (DoxX/SURF4 family)